MRVDSARFCRIQGESPVNEIRHQLLQRHGCMAARLRIDSIDDNKAEEGKNDETQQEHFASEGAAQ